MKEQNTAENRTEVLNKIEKEEPLEDIQFVKNFALWNSSIICSVVIISSDSFTYRNNYIYLFVSSSILANWTTAFARERHNSY